MRLDIYRRVEQGGNLSYLAVPEGHVVPNEVANIDWQADARAVDMDDTADQLEDFSIEQPIQQIQEKGYAITRLKNIGSGESGRMARPTK